MEAVLAAKEKKAGMREQLLSIYELPVVSVSVNMPGNVKTDEQIRNLLRFSVEQFRAVAQSHGFEIVTEQFFYFTTGPYAFLVVSGDARKLKMLAVAQEAASEVARLFDMDVFNERGIQISRASLGLPPRNCFVCNNPALVCMRSAAHSPESLQGEVTRRLNLYAAQRTQPWDKTVWEIAALSTRAMLLEAACTPAPGLVDMGNAGAHDDMDFFSFLQSSAALSGTMLRCAVAGWEHQGEAAELLPVLRQIGLSGEKDMLAATGGVNTQKGLLFLLGILVAAATLTLQKLPTVEEHSLFTQVSNICRGIVARELEPLRSKERTALRTAGERLYIEQGIIGIRGEMEAGLTGVQKKGLPCLREALAAGLSLNDALVHALVGLMTIVEDTTVANRHGVAVLREVQQQAKSIMAAGGMLSQNGRAQIRRLDETFILRNISPGGTADMLAATYFIESVSNMSTGNIEAPYV